MTSISFRSASPVFAALVALTLARQAGAHAGHDHAEPAKPQITYEAQLLELSPFAPGEFDAVPMSEKELQEARKAVNAQRAPASDAEKRMSPEFVAVRDRFLKVKNSVELDGLLTELDTKYDSFKSNDTRLFAAQAVTLIPMRGIIWRLYPIASSAKITHSAVLTAVKQLASGIGTFLPTEQWRAGFDFASLPYSRDGQIATQFSTEAQVQGFLAGPVLRGLVKARNRLKEINLGGGEVVWDNQLLYGTAAFQDGLDRYRMIGEVERLSVLANIHSSIAQITFGRAYSAEGSVNLVESLGRLYGIDGFLRDVQGAPARDRIAKLRSSAYRKWGVLNPDGVNWTKASFTNIRASAQIMAAIWAQVQKRPAGETWAVDPTFTQSRDVVRTGNLRVDDVLAMTAGPTTIRSAVTGETVNVNLPVFYQNPPQDLKKLFATEFDGSPEWSTMPLKSGDTVVQVKHRNYYAGSPTDWDTIQYSPFLPGVRSGADVKKAARVLSQSWGGNAALAPMLTFMN